LLFIFSSILFLRQLLSDLTERKNSTKLFHMLGSEPDLKMHLQNLPYFLPRKIIKLSIFDVFRRDFATLCRL